MFESEKLIENIRRMFFENLNLVVKRVVVEVIENEKDVVSFSEDEESNEEESNEEDSNE